MDSIVVAALTLALTGATLAQGPSTGQHWKFGAGNTPGWALMSVEERIEHRNRVMGSRTAEECRAYLEGHHRLMRARASELGRSLPESPQSNVCERLQRAGRLD